MQLFKNQILLSNCFMSIGNSNRHIFLDSASLPIELLILGSDFNIEVVVVVAFDSSPNSITG
jgi:hypothetical protein